MNIQSVCIAGVGGKEISVLYQTEYGSFTARYADGRLQWVLGDTRYADLLPKHISLIASRQQGE